MGKLVYKKMVFYKKTNNIYNVIQFPHYGGYNASLAQSVERFTRNEKVAGSIPACGSR